MLIEKMAVTPRERFGIPLREDDRCEWDLDAWYEIDPGDFESKGRATPFASRSVCGRCVGTVRAGKVTYSGQRPEDRI